MLQALEAQEKNQMLEQSVSKALQSVARDVSFKKCILQNRSFYHSLLPSALRFIGGETLQDCVNAAKCLNGKGIATSIDFIGENTLDAQAIKDATVEFYQVIRAIQASRLNSSISLDLSHIGLSIIKEWALTNLRLLATWSSEVGIEVMINMEGSEQTDTILEAYKLLSKSFVNLGITLQANLRRTEQDFALLISHPGKIRLVKGAFFEAAEVVLAKGKAVDGAYISYMEALINKEHPCSIATHDPYILQHAVGLLRKKNVDSQSVEFEFLYGVALERLHAIKDLGFRTRVYLPYGKEWYLYFCHRLAENPTNIYQTVIDFIGSKQLSL